jgi:SAM-dependent methyltransferase
MPNYGDPKYWDKRYTENAGTIFDWLEDYNSLKSLLSELLTRYSKILILGCGNARFSEDLYDDEYKNIYNIDISSVVIQNMSERNRNRPDMKYEVMDVCDIKYPTGYFDVAIDKSTIDALLCGDNAYINVAKMMKEV